MQPTATRPEVELEPLRRILELGAAQASLEAVEQDGRAAPRWRLDDFVRIHAELTTPEGERITGTLSPQEVLARFAAGATIERLGAPDLDQFFFVTVAGLTLADRSTLFLEAGDYRGLSRLAVSDIEVERRGFEPTTGRRRIREIMRPRLRAGALRFRFDASREALGNDDADATSAATLWELFSGPIQDAGWPATFWRVIEGENGGVVARSESPPGAGLERWKTLQTAVHEAWDAQLPNERYRVGDERRSWQSVEEHDEPPTRRRRRQRHRRGEAADEVTAEHALVANPAYPEALGAALRGAIADPDLLPAQKRAVLDMTLKGWSDLEIAAALRVDERTVRSHRSKAAALLRGHLT